MDASQHPTFEHDDGVGDDYDAPQAKKHGPTGRPPASRLDERLKQEAGKSAKVEIDLKNLFHRSPPRQGQDNADHRLAQGHQLGGQVVLAVSRSPLDPADRREDSFGLPLDARVAPLDVAQ
jgi:hypothetical protein